MFNFIVPALLIPALTVSAASVPEARNVLGARASIAPISTSEINSFPPYAWFASTAYCKPSATLAWNCGANCNANPDFIPTASGGDGRDVQYWYVGYSPSLKSVVVAHQGTDPEHLLADLTDADFFLTHLDSTLFPGIPSSVEVHDGFADTQADTATAILSAVQKTMSAHNTKHVTMTGHSLGAALAVLDSVYLPLHLPAGTTYTTIVFGLPRVGNPAFADWVDSHNPITHINNQEDPIPTCPGMFLGFEHPSGEIHITDSEVWENCPGQDNPSKLCIVGDVPNIFVGNLDNHDGPYGPVTMGC